jgi:hypothetical protein
VRQWSVAMLLINTIAATQEGRVANWRTLQELAGLR